MARLRYNGLTATLGAALTSSATSVTFAAALTHAGGTAVPTISGGDYIPLAILDSSGALSEIVSLTAYTSGATTGTITRAQESTAAAAHALGDSVIHAPTVADFSSAPTPTVRASTSGYSASGASFNATIPAGAAVGDLLLIFTGTNNTASTAPSGWTVLTTTGASAYQGATVFAKTCRASDPGATVSIAITGGTEAANWHSLSIADAGRAPVAAVVQTNTATSAAQFSLFEKRPSKGDLTLVFGSARPAGTTLGITSLDAFSVVTTRTDAASKSTVWKAVVTAAQEPTVTVSPAVDGIACCLVSIVGG